VRPSLESSIDELYKGPVDGFVAARTALARSLKGEEARQVKALEKPRVGAWAVNQLYWHARPLYERVAKSGERLRTAQIAALQGRRADLRAATEAHHKAISDAVTEASRLAAEAGVHPAAEELIRTFETLSLARTLADRPGRLTRPLQPQGFEALAGITVKAPPTAPPPAETPAAAEPKGGRQPARVAPANAGAEQVARARERERDRERTAAERKRIAAVRKAETAVARAEAAETHAREQWERRKAALERAVRVLEDLSGRLKE
jgi:hypothetical protein